MTQLNIKSLPFLFLPKTITLPVLNKETRNFLLNKFIIQIINIEPKNNLVFEGIEIKKKKSISECFGKDNFQVERSMISKDYAKRFIQELILEESR